MRASAECLVWVAGAGQDTSSPTASKAQPKGRAGPPDVGLCELNEEELEAVKCRRVMP